VKHHAHLIGGIATRHSPSLKHLEYNNRKGEKVSHIGELEGNEVVIVVHPVALVLAVLVLVVLILCIFCTLVISPNGPSPVYLIAKPYPTLRLPIVYLPKLVQAQVSELRVFDTIVDPTARHLLSELWRRGAVQRVLGSAG
jgi:hypothetical protein